MKLALSLFALLFLASAVHAQEAESDIRRVVLTDGTIYVGIIEDENADPLVLTTQDGIRREFAQDRVVEITELIDGKFFRTDPVRSRVFFAPSARTMGEGKVRADLAGYAPSVTYGITDNVDVLATGFLSFGTGGGGITPLVGLKATVVDNESVQVALGASALFAFGDGDGGFAAVPYGVATVGSETSSVSFGAGGLVGGSFDSGDFGVANGVILGVGGEKQINNGVKLFVEALTVVGLDGGGDVGTLILPGVRLFGNNFAFDIIGFVVTDYNSVYGFAPLPARISYTF